MRQLILIATFSLSLNLIGLAQTKSEAMTICKGVSMPEGYNIVKKSELESPVVIDLQETQADPAEAIQRARNEPNNFEAQMQAAQLYYQLRRYDEAIKLLLRANQLRPDNYNAIVALGNTYFDAEKYKEAGKWYTTALVKDPDDINVRTDFGLTFLFREPPDIDRAIAEFRNALKRDPRHKEALQDLTVALIRKCDQKEARATLARLEEVNPNSTVLPKLRSDLEKPCQPTSPSKAAKLQRGRGKASRANQQH